MSLEEAILDRIRHLPRAKQEEVLRFADGLRQQTTIREVPSPNRTRELKWMSENRAAFAGRWVALESDRLIAADPDARTVFAAARAEGIESPFVIYVAAEDPLPFASGW
jgi:hypothetical protein